MATAGPAKTKLVNGQRVSIATGQPFGQATPAAAPQVSPAVPQQPTLPGVPTTPVRLTAPSAFETALLSMEPRTQLDIQSVINENRKKQEQYLTALQPSGETLKIGEELANLRTNADNFGISVREGQLEQFGKGRPLALSTGRANKIQQNAALQQQSFAIDERNLLTKLGIAQEADQLRQAYARAGLDAIEAETDLLFRADELQSQREGELLERAKYLDQASRSNLADVIEFFQGADPDELAPEVRMQLQELATRRGIPFDLIMRGLEVEHTRSELDIAQQQAQLANTRSITANRTSGGGGGGPAPTGTAPANSGEFGGLTPQQLQKLPAAIKENLINMATIEDQIGELQAFAQDGTLEGVGFLTGPAGALGTKIFGTGTEEAKSVRALIGNIKGSIAKWRGGTSFTANEEKLLNSYVPTINENSASAMTKLKLLATFVQQQRNNTIRAVTGTSPQSAPSGTKSEDLRKKYNY